MVHTRSVRGQTSNTCGASAGINHAVWQLTTVRAHPPLFPLDIVRDQVMETQAGLDDVN